MATSTKTIKRKPSCMKGLLVTPPTKKVMEEAITSIIRLWFTQCLSPAEIRKVKSVVNKISNPSDFEVNVYEYLRLAGIYRDPAEWMDSNFRKYYYENNGKIFLAQYLWKLRK